MLTELRASRTGLPVSSLTVCRIEQLERAAFHHDALLFVEVVWDFENRLVRVEKTDGTVITHAYYADGNRVRTEVAPPNGPPQITNLLVDTSTALSNVVGEADGSNLLVALYVRGDDLLSVICPGQKRFFHGDGLGSIRSLTDENGTSTDTYTYSAFGELFGQTGFDPQPYAFAGEPYEPKVGLLYNRARWLDSSVGLFVAADPVYGSIDDPGSLHKYLYANQDPANRTDPTGLTTFLGSGFTIDTLSQLAATSVANLQAALQWIYINYFTI